MDDPVKAGDKLATLAQTSLPQNVILAQADLVSAQTALDDLTTSAETARIQALQAISNAAQAVRDAQYRLDNYIMPTELQNMTTMEALDVMQQKLDEARLAFEPVKFLSSSDPQREDLKEALDQAQADYNAAVKRLDYEYALQVAQSNLNKARQDYEKWKNGPNPEDVAAAEARIAAAQSAFSQAWIEAPFDGVVTLVDTQPGDLVSINTPAFRLDDLSSLLVDLAVSEVDINQIRSITYFTSYYALKQRANLQAGETLLVLGAAGGVGTSAVELGKHMGARVIAAASTDEKLALCKKLGADEVSNYSKTRTMDREHRPDDPDGGGGQSSG